MLRSIRAALLLLLLNSTAALAQGYTPPSTDASGNLGCGGIDPCPPSQGGTGVDNGTKKLTLYGNNLLQGGGVEQDTLTIAGSIVTPANSNFYGLVGEVNGTWNSTAPGAVFLNSITLYDVNRTGAAGIRNTRVVTHLGGSNQIGGFINFDSLLSLDVAPGDATNQFYESANIDARASVNAGGSSGTAAGSLFAGGSFSVLKTGATFWAENSGWEHDTAVQTGASVQNEYGFKYVLESDNAVAPTQEQVAFLASAQTGATATMDCVLCVGGFSGRNPLSSAAELIGWRAHGGGEGSGPTITSGIHLSPFTITGNAFDSTGFSVDGSGNETANSLKIPGTVLPTFAAGTLGLGGIATAPTMSAAGEGALYLSASTGLEIQGRGAAGQYDIQLVNGVGTLVAGILHSTQSFVIPGAGNAVLAIGATAALNTGDVLIARGNAGGNSGMTVQNASTSAAAATTLFIGNDTSVGESSFILNGANNVGGNGANSLTLAAAGGLFITPNTKFAGQITAQSMTQSSAAQSGTVCNNTGGTLTYDATLGCLASDERLKNISPFTPASGFKTACEEEAALIPINYTWKEGTPKTAGDPGQHIGLGAFATAYADERLIARDEEGNPRGWRQDAMIALGIACRQEQEHRIAALEKKAAR